MTYEISKSEKLSSRFVIIKADDDLQHHGILGQKWGVRRFQKKDGTLTAAGKKRLRDKSGKQDDDENTEGSALNQVSGLRRNRGPQLSSVATGRSATAAADSQSTQNSNTQPSGNERQQSRSTNQSSSDAQYYGNVRDAYSSAANAARSASNIANRQATTQRNRAKAAQNLSRYSDDELRSMVNRLNLERQYRDLSTESVGAGKRSVADTLQTFGDVLAVGASAASIALAVYQMSSKSKK